jgi:hypothetical protein
LTLNRRFINNIQWNIDSIHVSAWCKGESYLWSCWFRPYFINKAIILFNKALILSIALFGVVLICKYALHWAIADRVLSYLGKQRNIPRLDLQGTWSLLINLRNERKSLDVSTHILIEGLCKGKSINNIGVILKIFFNTWYNI